MNTPIQTTDIRVSTKFKGYGCYYLYINELFLMIIRAPFDEHFNACHIDEAFDFSDDEGNLLDEHGNPSETPVYHDGNNRPCEVYDSKEEFMLKHYRNEIEELIARNDIEQE